MCASYASGRLPSSVSETGARLCLSPDGQRYLARRDRRREADLLAHWRITPDEAGDDRVDVLRYRLDGSKLRGLARELMHTDGMNRFVATLAAACRASADWRPAAGSAAASLGDDGLYTTQADAA